MLQSSCHKNVNKNLAIGIVDFSPQMSELNGIFTDNMIKNIDLIIWLYRKPKGPLKNTLPPPPPLVPSSKIHSDKLTYDKNKVFLLKDRMGLYFNAMSIIETNDLQLLTLTYDPANQVPFWVNEHSQVGLNQDLYTDDPKVATDENKILVPTDIMDYTQLVADGTQELRDFNTPNFKTQPLLNKLTVFPFNGGDNYYGNTLLYNFYYNPTEFLPCVDQLPPLIRDLYQYLSTKKVIVNLSEINPDLEMYDLDDHVDSLTLKRTQPPNAPVLPPTQQGQFVPPVLGQSLSSVIPTSLYIDILKKQSLQSWKWIDNGCWLDNLLFAMFAPYPYLSVFEDLIVNINLDYTFTTPDYYTKNTVITYPKDYPKNVCNSDAMTNNKVIRDLQSGLRTDIRNLRSGQFEHCINLRQLLKQCGKLISGEYSNTSFRDSVNDLYLPLLSIFGLENLVTLKKTQCAYHKGESAKITTSVDYQQYLSVDITDVEFPPPTQNAHLLHLLNHSKLLIDNIPPTEALASTLIQKTTYYTVEKAPVLPILIRRTYKKYDQKTGNKLEETVFWTPIKVPEILPIDGKLYQLTSMVIRLPNQAHFNSLVRMRPSDSEPAYWIYYRNTPNLDQSTSDNTKIFKSYEEVLDSERDHVEKGCYLIFYSELPPDQSQPSFTYDTKCSLIPTLPSPKIANQPPVIQLPDVLDDKYIMPFVYPGEHVPTNFDLKEINEFVLKKKLLKTLVPKNKDIPQLVPFKVGQMIYNKTPQQIQEEITKLEDKYDYKEALWTPELNLKTTEIAKKLLNKGTIYLNVTEFVQEQRLLTILVPMTDKIPALGQVELHQLLHGKSDFDQNKALTKLKTEYHFKDELWTSELEKSAIIVGRLLKLLSNPSLAQVLSELDLAQSTDKDVSYWKEIVTDHTNITSYGDQITKLDQSIKEAKTPKAEPKSDPETKPEVKSEVKPAKIVIALKAPNQVEQILGNKQGEKIPQKQKIALKPTTTNTEETPVIDPLPQNGKLADHADVQSAELFCQTAIECSQLFEKYQKQRKPIYQLPEGDKKTMGAHLLYDIKSKSYAVDPTGWWFSEKYDGVRAVWTSKQLLTRNGKVINAPEPFLSKLPKDMALDGELYMGRQKFNQVQSIASKLQPDLEVWGKIKYLIYDLPDTNLLFEDRIKLLNDKLKSVPQVEVVKHVRLQSLADLIEKHRELVKDAAEGSMIRKPQSEYLYGHSYYLLKFKSQLDEKGELIHVLDDDAVILGYTVSTAKTTEGCLGSFQVEWKDKAKFPKNPKFSVGTGLLKIQKCGEYQKNFPIGTVIVVNYTELIEKTQAPRFPRFKEVRAEQ
jgi:ATP-dependent DNA ligase